MAYVNIHSEPMITAFLLEKGRIENEIKDRKSSDETIVKQIAGWYTILMNIEWITGGLFYAENDDPYE